MIKTILLLALSTMLFAKYTSCEFQNKDYTDVCEQAVKNGVSYDYANTFLLSYFKTKKLDEISWKYLQPKEIKRHSQNEKKANNTLTKYIVEITDHLKAYKEVYDYAEKKFGVNREIVASILIKETRLGKIKPTHDAFLVFNTIVLKSKGETPREKRLLTMGKTNMTTIITYCYKNDIAPETCTLKSSFAGAVGIPQFMPNSFVYIEGYQTKVGDLSKMEDAIVSASKFLNQKAGFDMLIDWDKMPDVPTVESAWYDYEFENKNASFAYSESKIHNKKYDCFSCKNKDWDYLREYSKKIMRYNNSSNYALGVMRLAYDAHKMLNKE